MNLYLPLLFIVILGFVLSRNSIIVMIISIGIIISVVTYLIKWLLTNIINEFLYYIYIGIRYMILLVFFCKELIKFYFDIMKQHSGWKMKECIYICSLLSIGIIFNDIYFTSAFIAFVISIFLFLWINSSRNLYLKKYPFVFKVIKFLLLAVILITFIYMAWRLINNIISLYRILIKKSSAGNTRQSSASGNGSENSGGGGNNNGPDNNKPDNKGRSKKKRKKFSTEEERREARNASARERWKNMSKEQKKSIYAKRADRVYNMSPEQHAERRAKNREWYKGRKERIIQEALNKEK